MEIRGSLSRLEPRHCQLLSGWCWLPTGCRHRYEVQSPYRITVDDKTVTVPTGFLTDGATCGPDLGGAFVYHDYLYSTHTFDDGSPCTRQEADALMASVLRKDGLNVYAAVFEWIASLDVFCAFSIAWSSTHRR